MNPLTSQPLARTKREKSTPRFSTTKVSASPQQYPSCQSEKLTSPSYGRLVRQNNRTPLALKNHRVGKTVLGKLSLQPRKRIVLYLEKGQGGTAVWL